MPDILFVLYLFHVLVDFIKIDYIAIFFNANTEGNGVEVEFSGKEIPLVVRHIDVLTLDVVLRQPLLGVFSGTIFLIADVEETHGGVFQSLHLLALVQHFAPAGSTTHAPEVNEEGVALVWLNDTQEESIRLWCGRNSSSSFYFALLDVLAIALQGLMGHNWIIEERKLKLAYIGKFGD